MICQLRLYSAMRRLNAEPAMIDNDMLESNLKTKDKFVMETY